MVVGRLPEVLAGRVFTLEGVTTVRVTVLVDCEDAAGWAVVVELVAAGRVTVVVVLALGVDGLASVLGAVTVEEAGLLTEEASVGLVLVPVLTGCGLTWAGLWLSGFLTASERALVTVLPPSLVGLFPLFPPPPALPVPVVPATRLS